MSADIPNKCPKCGAVLPADAPAALCPKCLLAAGLASDAGARSFEDAPTTPMPSSAGFIPPDPAALAGQFPQLEILELIGHGGMGAVYKARQTNLDRLVALKIIRPEATTDAAFAERFNREAKTLARLSHQNIVAVYDFGEVSFSDAAGGPARPLYFFMMEFVEGANLRQLLRAGGFTPEQALAIVPQICEALQFAHDEGVVHRDIKPENILIDKRGRVKIADFGLAKLATRSADEFTLTGTHQVMGTPRYMAPEQMEGSHAVDHRADIYSLGVVFYEMLTGQVPAGFFDPPSKKVEIDVRLDEVVLRAMAREPERRYQQASEVKSDVESISGTTYLSAAERTPGIRSDLADSVRQRLEVPATLLQIAGIFMCLAACVIVGLYLTDRFPEDALLVFGIVLGLLVVGGVSLLAGWNLKRLREFGLGTATSLLLLPVSTIVPGVFAFSNSPWLFAPFVLLLPVAIWLLRLLWLPEVKGAFRLESEAYQALETGGAAPQRGGRDWATLTREQIENDRLPDCCIVCGRRTLERVNKDFSFQADWAGLLTLVGCLFFLIPGLIIGTLTTTQIRMACPVCPTHRAAWRRLIWVASTGWLGMPLLGLLGFGIADALGGRDSPAIWVSPSLGVAIGLFGYLVPVIRLCRQTVDIEWMTRDQVRLCRVSAEFAREAEAMSGGPQTDRTTTGQPPRSTSTIRTAWDAWWAERD